MASPIFSGSSISVKKEIKFQSSTQSIGLKSMPVEILARLSHLLTTKENIQLLMVSTSIWCYRDVIEQTYRLELKGRIGSIFSSITSSFTTDVLPFKSRIMQVIDGMTFKTSQAVKEKCGSDLDKLVPLLISEYNGLPSNDHTREQKGLILTNFIASRPNMVLFAFQNADVRKLLRSSFAPSNGIPLAILDRVLVQKINLLAGSGKAGETEMMLALIERAPLRDGLRSKIIVLLVKQKDFVTAARIFNFGPLTKDSYDEVIETVFASCTVDEICIFAKRIQYHNDFRKEVFLKLIAARRLDEAAKIIEETSNGEIKNYMQKVMIQKNSEALVRQGRVDEFLALIPLLLTQNRAKTLKWAANTFAYDVRFGQMIRVINFISADQIFMKELVRCIHPDSLIQAQTFAQDISDLNMRKHYQLEIQAKLDS